MLRVALLLALTGLPVHADGPKPARKTVECYCTNSTGARVELGDTICLFVDGRAFMAQCQMSVNVPMWREVSEGCLSSGLERRHQPLQSRGIDAKI